MKKYNIQNYVRYKNDVASSLKRLDERYYNEYERDELIIKLVFLILSWMSKFSFNR